MSHSTNSRKKKSTAKRSLDIKRFIVRKYIYAKDVLEACRIEKNRIPDDVFVDDDWKSKQDLPQAIGFNKNGGE